MKPDVAEQFARVFKQLAANVCPTCSAAIQRQEQVGHCVYRRPCGHRLYQGKVGAFAPQPTGAAAGAAPEEELAPERTPEELAAWARSKMGGDTSEMLDE